MGKVKSGSGSKNLLAIVFCIPLAFIVYFAISYSSETISLGSISAVTVEAPGNVSVNYTDASDVDFFVSILQNSKQISTSVRDVTGEDAVNIIYDRGDKTLRYKLYPTLNLSGCLLTAPDGKFWLLDSADAGVLLLRNEFSYLYSSYSLPVLSVISGDNKTAVAPVSYDWKFRKSDDVYYTYDLAEVADGNEVYSVFKDFLNTLEFSSEPSELTDVTYITSSGVPLSISGISSLDFSVDTVITVSFTAKWSSVNSAACYGEAKYKFDILYDIPAALTVSANEFKQGDVIVVTASHLNENEEVVLDTLLSTSALDFTMIDDDIGVALLPIGLENKPGEYTLKMTSGASTVSETITVTALESNWSPISVSTEDYNAMLSPDKLAMLQSVIDEATAMRYETDYFPYDEGLRLPVGKKEILHSYGQVVNFANAEITSDAGDHTVTGIVYACPEDTSVRAAQSGLVVYSGVQDTTGNTVILYHGFGIYTYYYNLGTSNVSTGTTVTSGEIIGVAGSSGYTGGKTVLYYAVSIDSHFVNPAFFG